MRDITNNADILDIREIIERVEELRASADREHSSDCAKWDDAECTCGKTFDDDERETLEGLLAELAGCGDEQWEGAWYPVTLIRDGYFQDYAQELAEDIGAIPNDASVPCTCIDWEQAARELRMDYSSVEYDGVTYWYTLQSSAQPIVGHKAGA